MSKINYQLISEYYLSAQVCRALFENFVLLEFSSAFLENNEQKLRESHIIEMQNFDS